MNGLTVAERRETVVTIKQNTRYMSVLRCDAYRFIGGLTKTRTGPDPRTALNSRKTRARRVRLPELHVKFVYNRAIVLSCVLFQCRRERFITYQTAFIYCCRHQHNIFVNIAIIY